MKKSLLLICLFLITITTFAQITDAEANLKKIKTDTVASWKLGGISNVNISQTSLVNWAAGGQNSIALNGLLSLHANYTDSKNVWENSLDLGYGLLRQGEIYKGLMKTDDRIELTSKYGRRAFDSFYYAALLNFRTQFTPGYNYPNDSVKLSNFMAPAYVLAAVGLNYIPNKYFNAFLAPITGKMTIVNDNILYNQGAFGVEKGKKLKSELGGYLRVGFTKNDFKEGFFKNISITSKLDLFSNYLKDPQNIDVNWENLIGLKVNDFITISLNTHLIYDADVKILTPQDDGSVAEGKARVQFKEILGIGFMYKF